MSAGRIFVTRRIPSPGMDLLRNARAEIEIGQADEEQELSADALLAGARDADVVYSLLTERIGEEVLASGQLRGVANMAVGYDNIDVECATALGVPVSNTPGVLTESTADLTWALLLAVARRIPAAHEYMTAGRYRRWGAHAFLGSDVGRGPDGTRKVLGIIGYGRIGAAVARRALGFDMDVIAFHPRHRGRRGEVDFVTREEIFARSDFLSLHVPLNASTRHMIGAPELRAMRSSAFLINTARGPIVDERALVLALREGQLAGAGLDVYEDEPAMAPGLDELDNVVRLPHIASATIATRARMATIAAENALCHLRGDRAPNTVNPQVYETAAWRRRVEQGHRTDRGPDE